MRQPWHISTARLSTGLNSYTNLKRINYTFNPIGVIHTPFQEKETTPIQSARSEAAGTIEVFPQYMDGLEGVEEFSHLILFYVFDRSPLEVPLKVKPFLDDKNHGIFATRFPVRPNPLGFSVVRLEGCEGNRLNIMGSDMLDGTPLLDIKPYVPMFDVYQTSKTGWYENRARP
jgi:tRNA (adenine37-N6)-methyltransferase